MKQLAIILFSGLVVGGFAVAQDQPPLQRDLMTLAALFPGTYDNMEQVYFDGRLIRPETERHQRIRTEVRRMPNDRFGADAFFVLDYHYAGRQWYGRVYSLSMDEAEQAIRMRLHFFTDVDPAPYLTAHNDISVLENLKPDDLTHMPSCDVFWRPLVHGYQGTMKHKACVYEREGEKVYADFRLMLDDRSLWKGDVIRRLSDDKQVNDEPQVPHKQLKARLFTCSMSFDGEGAEGRHYPIALHDQGGEYFVPRPTEEQPDRQIGIRLRNVDWAMNNGANGFTNDVFVMYVVERIGEQDRNLTYTWGAPDEASVGLNLQWLLTSCYILPQEQSRPYLRRPPTGPWRATIPE